MRPAIILSSFPDYLNSLRNRNVEIFITLKDLPLLSRIIRRVILSIPLINRLYSPNFNVKDLIQYDTIILFANKDTLNVLKLLITRYPNKKYYFWYWNPVSSSVNPKLVPSGVSISTFDPIDAQNYSINYVESFAVQDIIDSTDTDYIDSDVYFIGADKNRANQILDFVELSKELNVNFKYNLIKDKSSKPKYKQLYSPKLTYSEAISCTKQSRCILDITQNNQAGLSQRFFESIILNKKIITTNTNVVLSKLYDPRRIFILGKDNIETLRQFISDPIPPLNTNILEYYSFDQWLKRVYKTL